MKKRKVIEASIFVVFCLVISNFSFAASDICSTPDESEHGEMDVVKEAYIEEGWTEGPIYPEIGDTIEFRLTLTYHNTSGLPNTHWAYDIRVYDYLPECLDYIPGTADPDFNFNWKDDPDETLFWDLEEVKLYDGQSYVLTYNATVVGPTGPLGQKNNVTAIWDERCTYGRDLESTDFLIIIVGEAPELNLIKRVWDPVSHQYVKDILAYEGETLRFRIDVENNGGTDLTEVVVNDTYPEFITPFEYSIPPYMVNTIDRYIVWHLGTIPAGETEIILFNATVNSVPHKMTGKNIANVTCREELFDEDNVTITVEKHFLVDKKVKHPETGEWVEEIPYVKGCEPVRFKINITYFGNERMKCLLVYDQLPFQCLEYDDNVFIEIAGQEITPSDTDYYPDIYLEGDTFIMCDSPVEVTKGGVYFSWVNQSIGAGGGLVNGDSVIIEFDASVVEYCEDGECCKTENCVEAWLWSCCDTVFYAKDCVNITCVALPGEFNKTVSLNEPTNWGKEVHTVQGYDVKFKLEMTYYGNENLTNVTFKDVLPCCLEYKETIQSPTGTVIEVSSDKKTIYWNVTKEVADCETVTIIFRADVIGSSECGACINYGYVYGYIQTCVLKKLVVEKEDTAIVYAAPNTPPHIPDVSGPLQGIVGVSYTFNAMLHDNEGDQISYRFDWGDGITDWLGPVSSGEVTETHTYSAVGTYNIRVKARDEHGAESEWTDYPWVISIKTASVDVTLETFNIGSVEAIVENTGQADLTNINFEFNISRESLLGLRDINVDGSGVISSLPQGTDTNITSDSIGLKLGMADVSVVVTKSGVIDPTEVTARAFIIGPIILILPE